MSKGANPTKVTKDASRAVTGARAKALVAFLILPLVFAAALLFILYISTHWPYPPGFEWASRWTPPQMFTAGLIVLAAYVVLCAAFVWRLVSRWLWEPAAGVLNVIEGTAAGGAAPGGGLTGDLSQFFYRIEQAADRYRSAAHGARQLDDVGPAVSRLCQEIERMGARRFDRDFSVAQGSLEPLGKCLSECCNELSSFTGGCGEIVAQISDTLRKARERAEGLSSKAESVFLGTSDLSMKSGEFAKRVGEAIGHAGSKSREEAAGERRAADEALRAIIEGMDACLVPLDRFSESESAGKEISSDSKRLADEATVIALNSAIEASRSGSGDLEALAEGARKLAEAAMGLNERVESLSAGYVETVKATAEALKGLHSSVSDWSRGAGAAESSRAEAASGIEEFLSSIGEMSASLAADVEKVAGLSESVSSEARAAGKAIEEALDEMESLKRRLDTRDGEAPGHGTQGE